MCYQRLNSETGSGQDHSCKRGSTGQAAVVEDQQCLSKGKPGQAGDKDDKDGTFGYQ
jgi:hypothetical protein